MSIYIYIYIYSDKLLLVLKIHIYPIQKKLILNPRKVFDNSHFDGKHENIRLINLLLPRINLLHLIMTYICRRVP